jgi:hypothetical protein
VSSRWPAWPASAIACHAGERKGAGDLLVVKDRLLRGVYCIITDYKNSIMDRWLIHLESRVISARAPTHAQAPLCVGRVGSLSFFFFSRELS